MRSTPRVRIGWPLVTAVLALVAASCGEDPAATPSLAESSASPEAAGNSGSSGAAGTTTPSTAAPAPPVPQRCPTDDEVAARSSARPVRVDVSERRYAGFGQRLDPPPSGASPPISESDAVRRAMAAQPAGFDPGPEPTVGLASYSDDSGGPDTGGTQEPIRDRLAWALLFPHAVTSEPTGAGVPNPATTTTTPPPCTLATVFVPVDANSGQVLPTTKTPEPVIGG